MFLRFFRVSYKGAARSAFVWLLSCIIMKAALLFCLLGAALALAVPTKPIEPRLLGQLGEIVHNLTGLGLPDKATISASLDALPDLKTSLAGASSLLACLRATYPLTKPARID